MLDFDGVNVIDSRDVVMAIQCHLFAIARFTGQTLPNELAAENFANNIVLKYKLATEPYINRSLLVEWIESVPEILAVYTFLDPPEGVQPTRDLLLFRNFKKMSLATGEVIDFVSDYLKVCHSS